MSNFYMIDNPNPNTAQGVFPRRGGHKPSGTCIIHTSESVLDVIGDDSTAEDCAAFIARRTDYGSYHNLVDSDSIIEMYPFLWETWQDSETNNWAVGISAACRTTDWNTMGDAKREGFYRNLAWCAADFVKYMKSAYNIDVPLRRISGAEARNKVPGFAAHGDSGIARSDPGRDFDWTRFFKYTADVLNGIASQSVEIKPVITKVDEMLYLTAPGDGKVWLSNGIQKWHVPDPAHIIHIKTLAGYGAINVYAKGDEILSAPALGADMGALQIDTTATVEITSADLEVLVASLKATLAPELASELAKRLAA